MKIQIFLILIISISINHSIFSQGKINSFIKKDTFSKIISVSETASHGDDFMTVNVFNGDNIEWGKSIYIISYRFLGIDSQNNLHVRRTENNNVLKDKDICELIYKLEPNKPTEITLIAQRSQKNPVLIKLQVEAGNNFIKSKYLGDFPIYNVEK